MKENEQDFELLRRLLTLKRHEVPPPGYFNSFSRQVMARIRAEEAEKAEVSVSLADRFGFSWLLRSFQALEATPAYAGGFATVLCLLLIFAAVMAERPEGVSQAFLTPAAHETASLPMVTPAPSIAQNPLEQSPGLTMVADSSTNPVVNFQNSYQDSSLPIGQPQFSVQPVSFPVMGN